MRLCYRMALGGFLAVVVLLSGALLLSVSLTIKRQRATRALVQAVQQNSAPAALAALRDGADPNVTNVPAPPPLTFWQCMLMLVHPIRPREITTVGDDARSPVLVLAARNQNEAILNSLLQDGANVNAVDAASDEETALTGATLGYGNDPQRMARAVRLVSVLLTHGAHVNAHNAWGATALMDASNNSLPLLKLLLRQGADVNARNAYGETALMMAAGSPGNAATIAALLDAGAQVNARDTGGRTALVYAEFEKDTEGVRLLKRATGQNH